jgi:hypothetical protein
MDMNNTITITNINTNIGTDNSQNLLTTDFPLTEHEKKIFSFLLEVVQHYQLGTTLRVAGGWVRDKVVKAVQVQSSFFSKFLVFLNFDLCAVDENAVR